MVSPDTTIQFIIIIVSIPLILTIAWIIGRFHISCVDPSEVGKLNQARFTARMFVYLGPLSAMFVVLGTFEKVIENLSARSRLSFTTLLAISGMFAFVILGLSFLETFWYRSRILSKTSYRSKFFRGICLPVLYSSLYLYWAVLIPVWILFIIEVLRQ